MICASSGTLFILTIQDLVAFPSKITVQAPHSPYPQPTFVPVSRNCFLSTSARVASGSATTRFSSPLINNVFLSIFALSFSLNVYFYTCKLNRASHPHSKKRTNLNRCPKPVRKIPKLQLLYIFLLYPPQLIY